MNVLSKSLESFVLLRRGPYRGNMGGVCRGRLTIDIDDQRGIRETYVPDFMLIQRSLDERETTNESTTLPFRAVTVTFSSFAVASTRAT